MSYFETYNSGINNNLDIPNCLTPNNLDDAVKLKPALTSSFTTSFNSSISSPSSSNSNQPPLSPPLSPYQRNNDNDTHSATYNFQSLKQLPSYLNPKSEFKVENYNDYKLTINVKYSKNYYNDQLSFLDKYSVIASNEGRNSRKVNLPVRSYRTRNVYNYDSPSEESSTSRVRTRRVYNNRNLDTDDENTIDELPMTSPKKRKTNNPTHSSTPTPTQQLLIDDSIPDYSPSYDTLPQNPKCLKIEWKGQPMDLSNDPNIDKLHPSEVLLASILRLPVIIYLDSKKRLFYEKVFRMKTGKQFRRTDAQKACRIDVNKASRLFAAFEKVGWLNDQLFESYL